MRTKKSLAMFMVAASFVGLCSCSNTNKDTNKLPKDAVSFLSTHYHENGISNVEETKNMMDYEVTLEDGTEIDFTNTGQWEVINTKGNDIPKSLLESLPEGITQYIQENYASEAIHKVEKKTFGRNNLIYRISFRKPNDIELNFTKDGEIISDDPAGKRLPSNASAFINKHYPDQIILSLVNDVDGDYNVTIEGNTEIDFDRKGNWFYIKNSKKQKFPESILQLLPNTLNKYIEKDYPEQYIRRIEKKSYGYRVKLNKPNNVELTFSKTGEFLSIESKASDNLD